MNRWFQDPRVVKAEADAFEAERAERGGDSASARAKHLEAANAFTAVALSVPPDHPNTRTDLAIAAIASFARAGDFGQAAATARRMLAEADALTVDGRAEIKRLLDEHVEIVGARARKPGRIRHVYGAKAREPFVLKKSA